MKTLKRLLLLAFLLANFVACNHAYRLTHFADSNVARTPKPEHLSLGQKINTILLGVKIPKSVNHRLPSTPFENLLIAGEETLDCWLMEAEGSKGVILFFHGFSSSKSGMLAYAEELYNAGYTCLMVDMRGNGDSTGSQCTIGFKEAEDVKQSFEFARERFKGQAIILFGTSMGAVAIMKSIEKYQLEADKLILECPFGSMRKTTKKRFEAMGVPSFPFADMLLFYGGALNGFNAYKHRPVEYAKAIDLPTLLLYGAKDARVDRSETDAIFDNLSGLKQLEIMAHSGHEPYLNDDSAAWRSAVFTFLNEEVILNTTNEK